MKRLGGCAIFVVCFLVTLLSLIWFGAAGPDSRQGLVSMVQFIQYQHSYMEQLQEGMEPEMESSYSNAGASASSSSKASSSSLQSDDSEPSSQLSSESSSKSSSESSSDASSSASLSAESSQAALSNSDSASQSLSSTSSTSAIASEEGTNRFEIVRYPFVDKSHFGDAGSTIIERRGSQLIIRVDFGSELDSKDYSFVVKQVFDEERANRATKQIASFDYEWLRNQVKQESGFHRLAEGKSTRHPVVLVMKYDKAEYLRLDNDQPDQIHLYQDEKGQTWQILYYENHYLGTDKGEISQDSKKTS